MWWRVWPVIPIGMALARKEKYNLRYEGEENCPGEGPLIIGGQPPDQGGMSSPWGWPSSAP